jgi:hypothetical protein
MSIKIKEPRYRDRSVLLARYRLPAGQNVEVEIQKGAYAGKYKCTNEVICSAPIESMLTKRGQKLSMRAIPLNKLERIA